MAAAAAQDEMQQQDDGIDEVSFEEVDKLTSVGINAGDVKKLKEAGFHTVASVLMATTKVSFRAYLTLELIVCRRFRLYPMSKVSEAKIEKAKGSQAHVRVFNADLCELIEIRMLGLSLAPVS